MLTKKRGGAGRQTQQKQKKQPRPRGTRTANFAPLLPLRKQFSSMKIRGSRGNTTVSKKDFVVDVITSAAGTVLQSALINPGNTQLFPWLSGIANAFDRYTFKKLVLHYVPRVGMNTDGLIYFAYDPSSTDPVPTAAQMLQMRYSASGSVRSPLSMVIDQNELRKQQMQNKYVTNRTSFTGMPAYESAIEFYMGRLTYHVSSTASITVGQIFIEYIVDLQDPQPVQLVTQQVETPPPTFSPVAFHGQIFYQGNPVYGANLAPEITLQFNLKEAHGIFGKFAAGARISLGDQASKNWYTAGALVSLQATFVETPPYVDAASAVADSVSIDSISYYLDYYTDQDVKYHTTQLNKTYADFIVLASDSYPIVNTRYQTTQVDHRVFADSWKTDYMPEQTPAYIVVSGMSGTGRIDKGSYEYLSTFSAYTSLTVTIANSQYVIDTLQTTAKQNNHSMHALNGNIRQTIRSILRERKHTSDTESTTEEQEDQEEGA